MPADLHSSVRRPNSLWPHRPYLKTDGERLVLMSVPMGGKYYNITIERFNDRGETILVGPETKFSARVIQNVQKILEEMFSKNFPNPEDSQVLFSDINGAVCQQVHLGGTNERFDISQDHDCFKQMEAVHALFFKQQAVGGTLNDKVTFLTPAFVSREELDRKYDDSEGKTSKPQKKAKIPKRIQKELPKALSDEAPQSEPATISDPAKTEAPKTQHEYVEKVRGALADASQAYQSSHPLLKGVSYRDLETYSNTKNPETLKEAYGVYQSVVQQPNDTSDDKKSEMMKWLKHHYLAAVEAHRNMRNVWERDQENGETDKDFEDWCKFYAAKAVALWIKVNYSPDALTEKLLAIKTASEANAPSLWSKIGSYLPSLWSSKPTTPEVNPAELKPF